MSWSIDFDKYIAESVYSSVENGNHLTGFSKAQDELTNLKYKLENMLFDCEWWGGKCESTAEHYDYMQKQLQDNPDDFSDDHAREVQSQSPEVLYNYAAALRGGTIILQEAIARINEISTNISNAKNEAEAGQKNVLDKIKQAIELMDEYLGVRF